MTVHRADTVRHAAFLLIASGYLALAVSQTMSPLLLVVFVPLVLGAYRVRASGGEVAERARGRAANAVAVGGALAVMAAIAGREVLPALVVLACWGGLALMYRPESERNYYQSFLAAIVQLVLSGATTDSVVFGFSILLFIVSGTLALGAMTLRGGASGLAARFAEREKPGAAPVPVVQNGAWEAEALLLRRLATLVTGIILASTIVLFFTIPRYGAGYFFSREESTERRGAFSDQVVLGALGAIQKSTAVAMRVELTNYKGKYPGILRWRGVGLGHFDGRAWRTSSGKSKVLFDAQKGFRETSLLVNAPLGGGDHLSQRVFLAQDNGVLFGATRMRSVWAKLTKVERNADDGLLARFAAYTAKHYTVTSDVGRPPAAVLRRAMAGRYPFDLLSRYTQLPERLDPRVAALARTVAAGAASHYDQVARLERHLRTQFQYSIAGDDSISSEHPVEDFLFRTRRGHCEYFASALALLARTLGIPARVVNGYVQGTFSRVGGYYVVTDADAHSWVEVFFPHVGWIDFDPAPPGMLSGNDDQSTLGMYWDAAVMAWRRYVIDYHLLDQIEYVRSVGRLLSRERTDPRRGSHSASTSPTRELPPLVAFVCMAACVLSLLVRRLTAQAHALAGRRGLGEATFYLEMLGVLAARGIAPKGGETPKELARRAGAEWPEAAGAVDALTAEYERVRFAERAVDRAAVAARLDELRRDRESPRRG